MTMMTKCEREDLQRLIRQREKVLKSAARQRSAELLADFENQIGQEFRFDQDEVWAEAVKIADTANRQGNALIKAWCRRLGIPDQFSPSIGAVQWNHRGYGNKFAERRAELRRMAAAQVSSQTQKAIVEIEVSCLDAQTKLAVAGLSSDAARCFVEALPSIEKLMPLLSFAEVAGEADPPVAEQLVSSNALRQPRHRERQKALRNASGPLQVTERNGNGGDGT